MEKVKNEGFYLLILAGLRLFSALGVGFAEEAAPAASDRLEVLNEKTLWRIRIVRETPEYMTESGQVGHFQPEFKDRRAVGKWLAEHPDRGWLPEELYTVREVPSYRLPADTPNNWMQPDYDDSSWARGRTPILNMKGGTTQGIGADEGWKVVLMRTQFEVSDPAGVAELELSAEFRGGLIAWLNGQEIGRAFMPSGAVDIYTLAEPYPDSVLFTAKGFSFVWYNGGPKTEEEKELVRRRWRTCMLKIPGSKLRRGINVLAVAVPRAPSQIRYAVSRREGSTYVEQQPWGKAGVAWVKLRAPVNSAMKPNAGPLPGSGFQVWNQSILQAVRFDDYPDPFASLKPVELIGVRNGIFAGQVVVADERPIKGLAASMSDLLGPGGVKIAAAAVQIFYGLPDGRECFDALDEVPPEEVPLLPKVGRALQPIWVRVRIPAEVSAGEYTGALTIHAAQVKPVPVPVRLKVCDWTLPDPNDYVARMDIVESPDSVGMAYGVPLWSNEHLALLDKAFALLSELATRTIYITAVRRTHFGNEHAMIRWVRDATGELTPEFSMAEKYLDVAVRRLGKIPGVILYGWEPLESEGTRAEREQIRGRSIGPST
ncbi:MAG: glycoside hydrolase domain-containing protein [Kiritimatiellia bacterium]